MNRTHHVCKHKVLVNFSSWYKMIQSTGICSVVFWGGERDQHGKRCERYLCLNKYCSFLMFLRFCVKIVWFLPPPKTLPRSQTHPHHVWTYRTLLIAHYCAVLIQINIGCSIFNEYFFFKKNDATVCAEPKNALTV